MQSHTPHSISFCHSNKLWKPHSLAGYEHCFFWWGTMQAPVNVTLCYDSVCCSDVYENEYCNYHHHPVTVCLHSRGIFRCCSPGTYASSTLKLVFFSYTNKKLCRCRGTARRVLSVATTKVTFKLTQGHWNSCYSVGHTWFSICLPLLDVYHAPFSRYYRLFPKMQNVTWPRPGPHGVNGHQKTIVT